MAYADATRTETTRLPSRGPNSHYLQRPSSGVSLPSGGARSAADRARVRLPLLGLNLRARSGRSVTGNSAGKKHPPRGRMTRLRVRCRLATRLETEHDQQRMGNSRSDG
jgi:hypothetical protein